MNNIIETTISSRTYIVWRKEIAISEVSNKEMWATAFGKVNDYIQKNGIECNGPGVGLYFSWDQPKGYADFAIGMAVAGVTEVSDPELSVVVVAESKASQMTVKGDYRQLMDAHMKMVVYTNERNIDSPLTIEEYTITGMQKPNPEEWETNLYYLHA